MQPTPVLVPIKVPTINIDFSPIFGPLGETLNSWANAFWDFLGRPGMDIVLIAVGAILVIVLLVGLFRKPAGG